MDSRAIQVNAHGGLGNQFFAYFAGLYIAKKLDCPLNLYLGKCDRQHADAKYDISSFCLNLNGGRLVGTKLIDQKSMKLIRRIRDTTYYRIKYLNKIVKKISRKHIEGIDFPEGKIPDVRIGDQIDGFFVSHQYFNFLQEAGNVHDLDLRNPSQEYLSAMSRLTQNEYIALHIRRGDMINYKEDYGNLNLKYYERALAILPIETNSLTLYIFSDDIQIAREFASKLKWTQIEIVSGISDPAENFTLFSKGSYLITANSSFSGWAALLSKSAKISIAPEPYFKNPKLRFELPTKWTSVESSWE